jgi:hypothetical protein
MNVFADLEGTWPRGKCKEAQYVWWAISHFAKKKKLPPNLSHTLNCVRTYLMMRAKCDSKSVEQKNGAVLYTGGSMAKDNRDSLMTKHDVESRV